MQYLCASEQCQRRKQGDKTQTMVAVQMGDEHCLHVLETHLAAAQLQLCALTAVYQIAACVMLHQLCRGSMTQGRCGAATAQYVYAEGHCRRCCQDVGYRRL